MTPLSRAHAGLNRLLLRMRTDARVPPVCPRTSPAQDTAGEGALVLASGYAAVLASYWRGQYVTRGRDAAILEQARVSMLAFLLLARREGMPRAELHTSWREQLAALAEHDER